LRLEAEAHAEKQRLAAEAEAHRLKEEKEAHERKEAEEHALAEKHRIE
jgi:hypothetical protein